MRTVGIDQARPPVSSKLLVMMVPGWFYVTHGSETGADFKAQRATFDRMGVANRVVPVDENGTVENNARAVAEAIRQASREGHQIVLASASKSGPEVAQAIGRELSPDECAGVIGWVSIGGVVRGTPIADRALRPDVCWLTEIKFGFEGFDLEGAKSMRTDRAGTAFASLNFPPHLRMVAFIPTPLSGNITHRADFTYACLRPHGPNDGFVLLADEILPQGSSLLIAGVDHFLEHEDRNLWTAALLRVIVSDLR